MSVLATLVTPVVGLRFLNEEATKGA